MLVNGNLVVAFSKDLNCEVIGRWDEERQWLVDVFSVQVMELQEIGMRFVQVVPLRQPHFLFSSVGGMRFRFELSINRLFFARELVDFQEDIYNNLKIQYEQMEEVETKIQYENLVTKKMTEIQKKVEERMRLLQEQKKIPSVQSKKDSPVLQLHKNSIKE